YVNGSQGSSNVSLQAATLLGGTGTIGTISSPGASVLRPGASANSPGILNSGNVNSLHGFAGTINRATAGTNYSQTNVTGTVTLTGSALSYVVGGGFIPTPGQQFIIINNDGADAVVGTFTNYAEGATYTTGNHTFTISYVGGTGNDVVLTSVVGAANKVVF